MLQTTTLFWTTAHTPCRYAPDYLMVVRSIKPHTFPKRWYKEWHSSSISYSTVFDHCGKQRPMIYDQFAHHPSDEAHKNGTWGVEGTWHTYLLHTLCWTSKNTSTTWPSDIGDLPKTADLHWVSIVMMYPPVIKHGVLENGPVISDFLMKSSIWDFPASHVWFPEGKGLLEAQSHH